MIQSNKLIAFFKRRLGMKGLDQETIEKLMKEAIENIDSDYMWNYVFANSNIKEHYTNGNVSIKEMVRVAFLSGINFALNEIASDEAE